MEGVSAPFSAEAVRAAIQDDLNQDVNVPPGHRGGLVTYANFDKIEVALATRIMETDKVSWNVELLASHEWTGAHSNKFGVKSKITW